jgi:hypothetical protein
VTHESLPHEVLAHERTSQFLEGVRRRRREIVTPEGVSLSVELAD